MIDSYGWNFYGTRIIKSVVTCNKFIVHATNDLPNDDIIIVCSPDSDAEEHFKVSPTLNILSGFNISKVFRLGSIRTSPFILPIAQLFPFSDHTISEENRTLPPINLHLKQRGMINGPLYTLLPTKNTI